MEFEIGDIIEVTFDDFKKIKMEVLKADFLTGEVELKSVENPGVSFKGIYDPRSKT